MKRSEQHRLLREILEDGDAANFRAASLTRGLAFPPRRRRRHRLAQVWAMPILAVLLILGLALIGSPGHQQLVFLDHGAASAALARGPAAVGRRGAPRADHAARLSAGHAGRLYLGQRPVVDGKPGRQDR